MSAAIVTGIFTLVGTLLGVTVGLFGERWVRTWGKVVCKLDWRPMGGVSSAQSPGGHQVTQRGLGVTFLNRKDVPVTVWDMRVVFYKGADPLTEEERPSLGASEGRPGDPVTLTPRMHVTRTLTLSVAPGPNEAVRQRAVEEADRIEFVAILDGARDIRRKLAPWGSLEP